MVTVIREDRFTQGFELILSMLPNSLCAEDGDLIAQLQLLSTKICKELVGNFEDGDYQLGMTVNWAVFSFLYDRANAQCCRPITIECIDKDAVRDIVQGSAGWQIAA